jgi:hypothetical protein
MCVSDREFIAPARLVVGEKETGAVRVVGSGMVVDGPEVAGFREKFAGSVTR